MSHARINSTPPPADSGLVGSRLGGLSLPIPAGMRDMLPEEAQRRAELARAVLRSFELFGYDRVQLPAFEYSHVLERGLGGHDASAVLRFVEPETGEVVALRPDMTPQVARMVATRLGQSPLPARLCYRGSVVRRRHERSRRHRQLEQAGIELVGLPGLSGDLEVIELACRAVFAAGLSAFTLDLANASIPLALLGGLGVERRRPLLDCLAHKDSAELDRQGRALGVGSRELGALMELPRLHGDAAIWPEAERLLCGTPAEPAMTELRTLYDALAALGLSATLIVDLGETSQLEYYSGMMFQILAEGPGEPIGSGGRYDQLFTRYGAPRAAAGFAIDIGNLSWALGRAERGSDRVKVLVSPDVPGAREVLLTLRSDGIASAMAPGPSELTGYGEAWAYTHILELRDDAPVLRAIGSTAVTELPTEDPTALAVRAVEVLKTPSEKA